MTTTHPPRKQIKISIPGRLSDYDDVVVESDEGTDELALDHDDEGPDDDPDEDATESDEAEGDR